jgi:hypothetical protein
MAVGAQRRWLGYRTANSGWQSPTYNAGANLVAIRLRQADLDKPVVQDLLRATFEILDQGAIPWSERHTQPPAETIIIIIIITTTTTTTAEASHATPA